MTSTPTTTPTPTPSAAPTALPDAEARALAQVLAAEQAAVYAYGVVGAQCDDAHRDLAEQRLQQHAARRDLVAGRLSTAHRTPAAGPPAYGLPFPVDSPAKARDLAAHVELAVAAANADLVAAAAPERRLEPARWLAQNAVAARSWQPRSVAFPGLPERS
ncbi:MAG: DUF4439 domain-containing protein [Angustibacter sp.]